MQLLDPAWVNIHQPDALSVHEVTECAPNALIMLRCWDIDDKDGERKREMYDNPIAAASKHMAMWLVKLREIEAELKRNGWAYDKSKWYISLVNEPDPAFIDQLVIYTREAMRIAAEYRVLYPEFTWRLGVIASSVGTFMKPSEGDQGWTKVKVLEGEINAGGHILIVHEYWDPRGPRWGEDAGNLAWRHHIIPMNVRILIREAGANGFIFNRFTSHDDGGWQKHVPDPKPQTYAAQVKEVIEGCDERVEGVLLYMLDFHNEQWWSFYTGPAMRELLAIKAARPQVPSPFASKGNVNHLPGVFNGKATPLFMLGDLVRTTTIVNARRTPGTQGKGTDDVLAQLSSNTPIELIEGPQHADGLVWWRTERGWVAEVAPNGLALLTNRAAPPVDAPPVPTNGIIHPHVAEAILQVESGNKAYASDGRMVIRVELHLLRRYLKDDALFNTYFYHDPNQGHLDQKWRRSPLDAWQPSHLGSNDFDKNQAREWEVFGFAAKFNREATIKSISMGGPQIMGFNHVRIGYSSVEAMFSAFQRSAAAQTIGFFNYCVSDPALFAALQQGNWAEIARRYNGDSKQVPVYVGLMKNAYQRIVQGG